MNKKHINLFLVIVLLFSSVMVNLTPVNFAENNIKLIVDGEDITHLSAPIIENNRTLVPIRFVSEALGADVRWDGVNRTVTVERGNQSVFLKIGRQLVAYNDGDYSQLSDVAPKIINDRTYVPVRLISNALGIGIEWDNETRSVIVDSEKKSTIEKFYKATIISPSDHGKITGETTITIDIPDHLDNRVHQTKLILADEQAFEGKLIGYSDTQATTYDYLPSMADNGEKVLVLGLYDENNQLISGDAVTITVDVNPTVALKNYNAIKTIDESITLTPTVNFLPAYISYEMKNMETGQLTTIDKRDPFGNYTWQPQYPDNGPYEIRVKAYDEEDNVYTSKAYQAIVSLDRKLSLSGVKAGAMIQAPTNLIASRNFDVTETQYLIKDINSGKEDILATIPYGSYTWFPTPDQSGTKELRVKVKDTQGQYHVSDPVQVTVSSQPILQLKGVGPNQVLTSATELENRTNVTLETVEYVLVNKSTNNTRVMVGSPNETYEFTPNATDAGNVSLQARAKYQGKYIYSNQIDFRIYLDKLYGAKPIIAKDKFLGFASNLATDSYEATGMSAALQTAQAILETGWGQSVPVDKYSGKFSNNLFGIKGSGSNGSVVSNTWEVYNGVTYRVDASFRAYHNVNESWKDHKSLLLNASRYEPFREVMYNGKLGAWAIRRAGYATDPQYPVKLIRIMDDYNLYALDQIEI